MRYQPGQRINPAKILEVFHLAPDEWGPIEDVYPEVKDAGRQASFHRQRNTTIFPPSYVGPQHLERLTTYGDAQRHVYVRLNEGKVVSVLIHVEGGYASVHIWRLRPPRKR